jgi:mono/diheme cytochrome c family protein
MMNQRMREMTRMITGMTTRMLTAVSRSGTWTIVAALAVAGAALVPSSLELVQAQGKSAADIYLDKCSVCHGADGAGKTAKGKKVKVKDVRQTIGTLTADQMIAIVTKGKGDDMAAFAKDFSADQITQLVDYYRGLAKK